MELLLLKIRKEQELRELQKFMDQVHAEIAKRNGRIQMLDELIQMAQEEQDDAIS